MKSCNLSKWSEDQSLVMKYQWLISEFFNRYINTSIGNQGRLSIANSRRLSIANSRRLSIDKVSDWWLAVESYKSSKWQKAHGLMWQMLHQFWKLTKSNLVKYWEPRSLPFMKKLQEFQDAKCTIKFKKFYICNS